MLWQGRPRQNGVLLVRAVGERKTPTAASFFLVNTYKVEKEMLHYFTERSI